MDSKITYDVVTGEDMKLIDNTIGDILKIRAEATPDGVAIIMGDWTCTWRELDCVSSHMATRLVDRGISKGTLSGIWSVNNPNWVITFFALVKLGAIPILINTFYKDEELKGLLNYADVEVLFYGSEYRDTNYKEVIDRISEDLCVRDYISIAQDIGGGWISDDIYLSKSEMRTVVELIDYNRSIISCYDTACMLFTSGTTSIPKGIELSHYNVVNSSKATAELMRWDEKDIMCIAVPLFHCFGVTTGILSCVHSGAAMYILPYFKTRTVWDAIDKGGCTVLNGVPSMFLALIRKPECKDLDGSNLKSGIIAGSPITSDEFIEICERFKGMHLLTSYGQTETSPCVSMADYDEDIVSISKSAGKIIEHVEVKIVNPDTGESCALCEEGEILVKGYNVMKGYYKLPKANLDVFTEDGWLRTGDIGRLDELNRLYITGRLKEMIIRAGENISPQEIEGYIKMLPWIKDAKVIGVPADVIQEEIVACIIPKDGEKINEQGLIEYLKPRLAEYKLPAHYIELKEYPMNASGKILLERLKSIAINKIDKQ